MVARSYTHVALFSDALMRALRRRASTFQCRCQVIVLRARTAWKVGEAQPYTSIVFVLVRDIIRGHVQRSSSIKASKSCADYTCLNRCGATRCAKLPIFRCALVCAYSCLASHILSHMKRNSISMCCGRHVHVRMLNCNCALVQSAP